MVKSYLIHVSMSVAFLLMIFVGFAFAWSGSYHLGQEWVEIRINQNGTIDLFYNISITLDSGDQINFAEVGQPKGDFTIGSASDQYGHNLSTSDTSSGDNYKVQVTLFSPLTAGKTVWFTLITNVAHMIYEDTTNPGNATNPGNVGMKFIPMWWPQASVNDLRVLIVLPPNVTANQVRTLAGVDWNGTQQVGSSLAIYFEKLNLAPNEQYPVGVSFPKEYVQHYDTQPSGPVAFFQQYGPPLLVSGVVAGMIVVFVVAVRKRAYMMPTISMESLGIRRGLTAVEASYLLDMKPTRIVTEILYSLLQKRAVWVESVTPSIKLRIMEPFEDKKGTRETPMRYYEIDFLNALKEDGTLDEEKLAGTIMYLRDTVEEKLRGYRRRDTVDYYASVVAKAWEQVEQAGAPELASKAYDEQLLWLFLDPNVQTRTQTAFRSMAFQPSPLWLWYWYGYQHYYPNPTYTPNVQAPTQAAKPPTIPGADFANNIATAVENTSNGIVVNLEKFANAILPFQPGKASNEPAHHGADCVCACAACACACACVSCACACAGGGVGLKGDGLKP
jgi:hypothetical protein